MLHSDIPNRIAHAMVENSSPLLTCVSRYFCCAIPMDFITSCAFVCFAEFITAFAMKGAIAAIIAAFTSGIVAENLYDAQAETIVARMVSRQTCSRVFMECFRIDIVMHS